jgi:cytochrome d ubiquinol oxidase subunit II
VTLADAVGVVLLVGVTLYAVFAGADFGSGVWDLVSGSAAKGARSRALIDVAIGPVWEANHVWLIFSLVVLWTAFPPAFAAIMTTLYLPLSVAAVGIVLRGSGFAFRKATTRFRYRRAFGVVFASSSVITPFFLGAVAGGIASGRVPPGGNGDPVTSWVNPTSILGGVLAVAACAFLAAVYLTHDAVREGDPVLERLFAHRSLVAGVVVGVVALGGVFVLRADAPYLFDGLTHEALPLVMLSGVVGVGAMVLAGRARSGLARALAAGAVASVVWGWGVAQNPYILPEWLTVAQAASPSASLWSVLVVLGLAAVTVVPGLLLLYRLDQMSLLDVDDVDDLARENAG